MTLALLTGRRSLPAKPGLAPASRRWECEQA
jgi:hypothetical protein